MPYFVFKITPTLSLTHIETQERYQDARATVRKLRSERPEGEDADYRMIFAKHQLEAEKLLSRPRDNRVIGED
jgi:hypothetical protein